MVVLIEPQWWLRSESRRPCGWYSVLILRLDWQQTGVIRLGWRKRAWVA